MAGQIPREFVAQLLERVDIVDVIGEHVSLRKSGRNHTGLCPFHREKTPSFSVNQEKQFYYCFGCQASGDVLNFIREQRKLDFVEAVEYLASRAGMTVPRQEGGGAPQRTLKPLYALLETAMRFYEEQLASHPQARQAREYLQRRGLIQETMDAFHVGFVPPGRDHLLRRLKQEAPAQLRLAERIGLLRKRDGLKDDYYDYFRNRIIFPIRDARGRTVGFGGRALREEEHPKYLNSPETPLFHKRRLLYGLHEALQAERRPQRLLLVEGYLDVLTLHQNGMPEAVAALGVSPSREHLELAFRHASELAFCFDGDRAGREAAVRQLNNALACIQDGRTIRFLFLPDGEDPDSLVRKRGIEPLQHLLERDSAPLSEFLFQHLQSGLNLDLAEGRATLGARIKPYLKLVPPSIFKTQLERKLSELLHIERQELKGIMRPESGASAAVAPDAATAPPASPPLEIYAEEEFTPASGAPTGEETSPAEAMMSAEPLADNAGDGGQMRRSAVYSLHQRMISVLLQSLELAEKIPDDCPLLDDSEDGKTLAMLCEYRRLRPSGSGAELLGELAYLHSRTENPAQPPLEGAQRVLQEWRQPERERILHRCRQIYPRGLNPESALQTILARVRQHAERRQKREEVQAMIGEAEDSALLNADTGHKLREGFRGIRQSKNPD